MRAQCGISHLNHLTVFAATDEDAEIASLRCLDARAHQPIANLKQLSGNPADPLMQMAQRVSSALNAKAASREHFNDSKLERVAESEVVAESEIGAQKELELLADQVT